ncbi:unnamed protein product [Clonostachys byssicola]|uniref:Uncharacterized protein n=1 Tax=Clonostachys byssicola TaxID=160290 RepID=A0A9N9Y371_9HYPO|nr:unnamed protein product [Clonostachys byssicola]
MEIRPERSSKADDHVKGGVSDEPVVLRGSSIKLRLLILETKVLLALVRSRDNCSDDGDDLLQCTILRDQNRRTTSLESGGDISVDVGHHSPSALFGNGSVYVPFVLVRPCLQSRDQDSLCNSDDGRRGRLLGGHTRLPFGARAVLPNLEDTGIDTPESGNGSLAAAFVRVAGKGEDLLDGLLNNSLEIVGTTRVGDDVAKNVESNLLLKSHGGDSAKSLKIFEIIPVIITLGHFIFLVIRGGLDLDLLAADHEGTVDESAGIQTREIDLFLFKLKGTLKSTLEEVVEVLLVDLGKVGPKNKAGLFETRVVNAQSLLTCFHQLHDVWLEGFGTNSQSDATHAVAGRASQLQSFIILLGNNELSKSFHDIVEVGEEVLLHRSSNGTKSRGGRRLDAIIRSVLSHDLGVNTITECVKGSAGRADNVDVHLVGRTFGSGLQVLQDSIDKFLVVGYHLIHHLFGEVNQTNQRGISDLSLGVAQKSNNDREERLQLSGDEVRGTLGSITESKHGGHTELRLLVSSEDGELFQKGDNDLTGRKLVSKSIDKSDGAAGRSKLLVIVSLNLANDVHGLDHELRAHILHSLNLHAAVANRHDEEVDGLSTRLLINLGVGSNLQNQVEKILKVLTQQVGVVSNEGLEYLEDSVVALAVLILNSSLEDVDEARQEALEKLCCLRVLLWLNERGNDTNRANNVDTNVLALGVLQTRAAQLEQIVDVVEEVHWVVLEHGVKQSKKLLQKLLALLVLDVHSNNTSNQAAGRVAQVVCGLLQKPIEKVCASKLALVLGSFLAPILGDEAEGLHVSELADILSFVGESDLDQKEKRLGLGVEVLLEFGSGGLNLFGVCCEAS